MPEAATYAALLAGATQQLQRELNLSQTEARLEALLFICRSYAISKASVLARLREPATPNPAFDELLARRLSGEPVAYILAEREFYGLMFEVGPAVLIPRPETELLVELALAKIPAASAKRVLELGSGSGAIAIALAQQRPQLSIIATDISQQALQLAARNSARHGTNNITWRQSDWFEALPPQRFDLIVSNPPYVAASDPHLGRGDLRFEPRTALASGADGLDAIRIIGAASPAFLARDGWLMFEHGYDQGAACREILGQNGFTNIETRRDLADLERVSLGQWQPAL